MNHCNVNAPLFLHQRAWTLVELLVAMTLSLLLIAGIGQIYLAAKRSYDIQTSLARIQDVGRYATEVLTQDIRRAGYWGVMDMQFAGPGIINQVAPAPTCVADNTWGKMVTEKIFGLNDSSGGYACINRLRGDVLTVRYGDPTTTTPYAGIALYIRTTPLAGTIGTGPAGALGTDPTSDLELVAHAYYVASSNEARECGKNGAPAPFLPALDREYLITTGNPLNIGKPKTEELVTGVEQLQFQYGVDTDVVDIDKSVNQYMDADVVSAAALWPNVRSVRFWILVRDDCPDPSYTDTNKYNLGDLLPYEPTDHYRRALYTTTVALRNK